MASQAGQRGAETWEEALPWAIGGGGGGGNGAIPWRIPPKNKNTTPKTRNGVSKQGKMAKFEPRGGGKDQVGGI